MTTEEIVEKYWDLASLSEDGYEHYLVDTDNFKQALIEFATYHVKLALKQALERIPCLGSSTDIPAYKEAVLNAYPLENIK